jgi:hypothetical protein
MTEGPARRASALAALTLLLATPAAADCLTLWDLLGVLGPEWSTSPAIYGRHHMDGKTFLLLSTAEGEDWAAITVAPGGCATIVASGTDLTVIDPPARDRELGQ